MATNTTNFDLVKPAYSDTADIATINGNMDKADTSLNALGKGLAIISKNNTHDAITSGQYVYVHGHGSLAEGLYRANNNIAANGTLNSTNLTAVSGGLGAQVNTLAGNVSSLSDQIGNLFYQTSAISVSPNSYTEIDYPTGYTRDNTRIISCVIANYYTDYRVISFELTSTKIKINNSGEQNWTNVKLLLYKVS